MYFTLQVAHKEVLPADAITQATKSRHEFLSFVQPWYNTLTETAQFLSASAQRIAGKFYTTTVELAQLK